VCVLVELVLLLRLVKPLALALRGPDDLVALGLRTFEVRCLCQWWIVAIFPIIWLITLNFAVFFCVFSTYECDRRFSSTRIVSLHRVMQL
jgi:hypothetical protein